MGIENLVFQTYNSTGSQSVGLAIEPDNCNLIDSQFLTNPDTQYLNGTGISLIKGMLEDAKTETFNLPNECDAISEIIYDGCSLEILSKIEVLIGQINIQTIYPHDIMSRNITELRGDLHQLSDTTYSIPFPGRATDKRNSFLQAGARMNKMSLKFTYLSSQTGSTSLCVCSHQFTDSEKEFISKNIINRVVRTSMPLTGTGSSETRKGVVLGQPPGTAEGLSELTGPRIFDLGKIDNINVSHILIYSPNVAIVSSPFSAPALWNEANTALPATDVDGATVPAGASSGNVVTIKIGGTGAHGLLKGDYIFISFNAAAAGTGTQPASGIYKVATVVSVSLFTIITTTTGTKAGSINSIEQVGLQGAELVLGNYTTGEMNSNGRSLATKLNSELFSLKSGADGLFIIKLADRAFSTAGIPFSRLNYKKLKLKGIGTAYITVCGTQLQTTVGDTTSFSA